MSYCSKLIVFVSLAMTACAEPAVLDSTRAGSGSACQDDCPPACPGVELHITKRDALNEVLEIYCSERPEAECAGWHTNNWCTVPACEHVICGDQLTTHWACLEEQRHTIGNVPTQPCLDFYAGFDVEF